MSQRVSISAAEARRIALAAQGFDRPRPKSADDARHFRRALARIGVLQLDFVNVLLPAHFFMIWSRLGPYDRGRFEKFLYGSGEYIEHWAHEASIVAADDWPRLRYRREAFEQHKNSPLRQLPERKAYLRNVIDQVRREGPLTAHDLPQVAGPKNRKQGDWHRPIARWALEHHFGKGSLAVARRMKNFQREYDLPVNILADDHLKRDLRIKDAKRELLLKAAASLGIATADDIADYYRMTLREANPRIRELVEEGELAEVVVDGWQSVALLHADARIPRRINGASLLSPFDPLVWYRPRTMRIFEMEYRIEIYVPAAKRRWGYYVLPFRQGDALTARVDLKADRKQSALLVQSAHLELSGDRQSTAEALASELRALADWLQLASVEIKGASAFEKALASLFR